MKLDAFQQAFAHSVMAKKSPHALAQHFKQYSNAEFEERISIYRNNFFASTSDVLKETFSTIEKLVGEDFFRALASAYIQQHPPKQPAMIFLGHDFPQFIRRFEHTQSLPYLADIAHSTGPSTRPTLPRTQRHSRQIILPRKITPTLQNHVLFCTQASV